MKSIKAPWTQVELIELLSEVEVGSEIVLKDFKWWDGKVSDHPIKLLSPLDYRAMQSESLTILRETRVEGVSVDLDRAVVAQALSELIAAYDRNLVASKEESAGAARGPAYELVGGSLYRLHGNLYLMRCESLAGRPLSALPKRADAHARALISERLRLPTIRYMHVAKLTEDYISGVSVL